MSKSDRKRARTNAEREDIAARKLLKGGHVLGKVCEKVWDRSYRWMTARQRKDADLIFFQPNLKKAK